ncbi:glycosyltransferase [Salinicola endophyticus]|uniref:Glycosyltransferase n=1 Tax=Salinicola endophyticus TaxID=1949083 RepID=A0AB74UBZ9_9GAMM
MDELISYATDLANNSTQAVSLPIPGRVAYVVSHGQSYASNGYAVRTQRVAFALNQHGFETLCFVRPGRPWELDQQQFGESEIEVDGVRYIHRSGVEYNPRDERKYLKDSADYLVSVFRVYRPSLVIVASNYIIGLPAWVAAKRLSLPFYNEVRGFWELSQSARDSSYENTTNFKMERERDAFVAKQAKSVFTLNSPMREELVRRGVASNIEIVPNAVERIPDVTELDIILRQRLNIDQQDKVVGYVGSVNSYEGLDDLISACQCLRSRGSKIKLVLVGDEQPVTHAVQAKTEIAKGKACEDSVADDWLIQTGRVAPQDVASYYSIIDAIVIPRKKLPVCELVPPMKAAEAQAYGKPLVVTDLPALRSACSNSPHTIFVTPGDVASLAAGIDSQLNRSASPQVLPSLPNSYDCVQNLVKLISNDAGLEPAFKACQGGGEFHSREAKRPFVEYATASSWFYREGRLSDTKLALDDLVSQGVKFDKPKREFRDFVGGLCRLKGGISLPPRQPNPGFMTKRKHALYCLHQSVPHTTNGYATRSHGIAVGLQRAGWHVRVTTRPGFPWDLGVKGLTKGYHISEVDGVTYAACAGWNLAKTPLDFYLAEAADHYVREAQTSGAEVIIAASNHITALPALLAARRLGLPFVYEVRGLWEVTQASTQPDWAGSERYHLMRELEQQAALEADLVITLTSELAEELVSWGVPAQLIEVVPNAVDAKLFRPAISDTNVARELQLPPSVPVIGYAGSAVAYEGLELLLDALARLKQKGQEFVFVLVGDGKVIESVKSKAKALGIDAHCRFTGRVPFDQVSRYLSCMDIMPIPRLSSAVTEMVSALKPLEAMAMGKAVVLSDVSPHKVMAGNGERAQLFNKDDAEDLCRVIKLLIDEPERRSELGRAARQWVEQERTWSHVTSRYADALQQLKYKIAPKRLLQAKRLDKVTLGLIADKFTTDTLASAVKVVPLSPNNWYKEIEQHSIDAVFVESAWKGNDGQWYRKVGHYGEEEFSALSDLLNNCRERGIPSLFWNKEDPVHFDRFRKAASLCDHVFTTDSRRIIPYLATAGALTQTASSAPFYASPKIHNLLPSTRGWQPTAAYGGTYYGKRYPERTEYMDKIMSAAAPLGLTIYDRQHDDPNSPYKYPGGLGGYVAGSLDYEQMIQAYKAHPVQINVNSVLDSPTMFSRRVIEAAACGAPLISGPALGMNRYLEGAGHIVRTESDAAQALENLLQHPAYRWRSALKGARAVMRSHTTELRLCQMLRTAGFEIEAPQPPEVGVIASKVTLVAAKGILTQTLRPTMVFAEQWEPNARELLLEMGIECATSADQTIDYNSLWVLSKTRELEYLEPEDFEDLAWPTFYASQKRIGFIRDPILAEGQWPGVALKGGEIDDGLQLVVAPSKIRIFALKQWAGKQSSFAIRKPDASHDTPPNVVPVKTVVIAGHDLKFIRPFYPYFTNAGFRLLLDFWSGHNYHNEISSKRLVKQADTIFCEWMLGNAIWYAKNKLDSQALFGRLHAQELRSPLFEKIQFDRFDKVVFVGPHMLRNAQKRNASLSNNAILVYNGVDVEKLRSVPRKKMDAKVLGLVGMVPRSKRLDLALDVLRELRREDRGYVLKVKGKRPEDYPWMANRLDEMEWYREQYRRLNEDPLLKDSVIFDPHGDDMPQWYSEVDYILSVSDHESFHLAIAEGASAGCYPLTLPWEGADEIYPKNWIFKSTQAMVSAILNADLSSPGNEVSIFSIDAVANDLIGILGS